MIRLFAALTIVMGLIAPPAAMAIDPAKQPKAVACDCKCPCKCEQCKCGEGGECCQGKCGCDDCICKIQYKCCKGESYSGDCCCFEGKCDIKGCGCCDDCHDGKCCKGKNKDCKCKSAANKVEGSEVKNECDCSKYFKVDEKGRVTLKVHAVEAKSFNLKEGDKGYGSLQVMEGGGNLWLKGKDGSEWICVTTLEYNYGYGLHGKKDAGKGYPVFFGIDKDGEPLIQMVKPNGEYLRLSFEDMKKLKELDKSDGAPYDNGTAEKK